MPDQQAPIEKVEVVCALTLGLLCVTFELQRESWLLYMMFCYSTRSGAGWTLLSLAALFSLNSKAFVKLHGAFGIRVRRLVERHKHLPVLGGFSVVG